MKTAASLLSILYYLFSSVVYAAPKVVPVGNVQMYGGQWFFDGNASALGGNMSLNYTPALKFSERFSLMPTYTGTYSGTKDVQELAGGGTLFQDETSHGVSLKSVYAIAKNIKLKNSAGYKANLLREVKNENWGKGLFDYRKFSAGTEIEAESPILNSTTRLGYDFNTLNFPNYKSLESAQEPSLARELAGTDVLDSKNHMISLSGTSRPVKIVSWEYYTIYTRRSFPDQPLAKESGELDTKKRIDSSYVLNNSFYLPLKVTNGLKLILGLGYTYRTLLSNQNHYDAVKTAFQNDYYSYKQQSLNPEISLFAGEAPWKIRITGGWQKRTYSNRTIQSDSGDYLTDKLNITQLSSAIGISFPFGKHISFMNQFNLNWSHSNMKYEKIYRYNYKIASYMFGIGYEY